MTETLKKAIRASGESLYAISKATGVNKNSLARFLDGRTTLRLDVADKLAAHFGIKVTVKPARAKRPTR